MSDTLMGDMEIERFEVRSLTRVELERFAHFTKRMLFVSTAASLAIVGAAAFALGMVT